jgi:hypothetical protein
MRRPLASAPTTATRRRSPVADTGKHPSAIGTERGGACEGIDDYLAHKTPPIPGRPPVAPWSATYPSAINGDAMQEYTQGDPAAAA